MIPPITVYPTETAGRYRTENGRTAWHPRFGSWAFLHCFHCLQILDVPSRKHWQIGEYYYCHRCIVVADEAVGVYKELEECDRNAR